MRDKNRLAPNLMTVFNLLLGFLAIVAAMKGNFTTAAWFILIAAVCDFLDGKIARVTRGSSDFGIEFDSLADVVSFGVAPAFLIYAAQMREHEPVGLIVSFLPLAAGAVRLARFNATTSNFEKRNFIGMPIPTAAGLLCSYVIFSQHFWDAVRFPIIITALAVAASVLMVSTVEFEAMPKFSFRRGRKNTVLMLLLLLCLATILIFPEKALFPLTLGYILSQLGRAVVNYLRDDEEEPMPDVSISKH